MWISNLDDTDIFYFFGKNNKPYLVILIYVVLEYVQLQLFVSDTGADYPEENG